MFLLKALYFEFRYKIRNIESPNSRNNCTKQTSLFIQTIISVSLSNLCDKTMTTAPPFCILLKIFTILKLFYQSSNISQNTIWPLMTFVPSLSYAGGASRGLSQSSVADANHDWEHGIPPAGGLSTMPRPEKVQSWSRSSLPVAAASFSRGWNDIVEYPSQQEVVTAGWNNASPGASSALLEQPVVTSPRSGLPPRPQRRGLSSEPPDDLRPQYIRGTPREGLSSADSDEAAPIIAQPVKSRRPSDNIPVMIVNSSGATVRRSDSGALQGEQFGRGALPRDREPPQAQLQLEQDLYYQQHYSNRRSEVGTSEGGSSQHDPPSRSSSPRFVLAPVSEPATTRPGGLSVPAPPPAVEAEVLPSRRSESPVHRSNAHLPFPSAAVRSLSAPQITVAHAKSTSQLFQTKSHWEPRGGGEASLLTESGSAHHNSLNFTTARDEHRHAAAEEIVDLTRTLKERNEEIIKLRGSLCVALQCYASPPIEQPATALERRFLGAVQHTVDHPDADPTLLLDTAPPHIQGLPSMPLPLDINGIHSQMHGFLQMLETEEKTLFKRSWKARFVVGDHHGISIFREEVDYKQHAFQRAVLVAPYHDMEFFVPSFRDAVIPDMLQRATDNNDPAVGSFIQMTLITHQFATDNKCGYFGFIAKQTATTSKNPNPQLVFRTSSWQEHSDWVHFFARNFNLRLYRELFPMMLAETMFALICKSSQTESLVTPLDEGCQASEEDIQQEIAAITAMLFSPPPPPPTSNPSVGGLLHPDEMVDAHSIADELAEAAPPPITFTEAGVNTVELAKRATACQTDELQEWVSASVNPTTAHELSSHEVAIQMHIQALQDQIGSLQGQISQLYRERNDAMDHNNALQSSLSVAEGETKRLRAVIADEHEKGLKLLRESQSHEVDIMKTMQQKLLSYEKEKLDLAKEIEDLKSHNSSLTDEIASIKEYYATQVKALASKAVSDMDTLHSMLAVPPQTLRSPVGRTESLSGETSPQRGDSALLFSPPRPMLREELQSKNDDACHLGTLAVLCNSLGDVQFNLQLADDLCAILSTKENRAELRKTWTLETTLTDGLIELSASLVWNDELGHDTTSSSSSSSLNDDDVVTPPTRRDERKRHTRTSGGRASTTDKHKGASSSSVGKPVRHESTQSMLDRLNRVVPPALAGRVGLPKKLFSPYV